MDLSLNNFKPGGRQICCDMYKVNSHILESISERTFGSFDSFIKNTLLNAQITLLSNTVHHFGSPGSFTALYLLAESHLSIHTWPEHGYIALDVFTCGDSDTQHVVDQLIEYFKPMEYKTQIISRG